MASMNQQNILHLSRKAPIPGPRKERQILFGIIFVLGKQILQTHDAYF